MKEEEVDQIINDDMAAFYNAFYEGVPLPSDFINLFRKALMTLPPTAHQIHNEKVKLIIAKKENQLTRLEVALIVNVIVSAPLEKLYRTLEKAIEVSEQLELIMVAYNRAVHKVEQELTRKKQSLMSLGGVRRPKSIIAQA